MIGTDQTALLSKLISVAEMRHEVISQNLANVNTPGYQRLQVDFEDELKQQMQSGKAVQAENILAGISTDTESPARADGNNVDISREVGELQKNTMLYETWSQLMASQVSLARRAMDGP